jgi:hypothetical protein
MNITAISVAAEVAKTPKKCRMNCVECNVSCWSTRPIQNFQSLDDANIVLATYKPNSIFSCYYDNPSQLHSIRTLPDGYLLFQN